VTEWTAPKAKRRKTPKQGAASRAMAAKRVEGEAVKTYMSAAGEHDLNNMQAADWYLRQRAELGDECFPIRWSLAVMARLRPDIEL
jgi:hypothetical protein